MLKKFLEAEEVLYQHKLWSTKRRDDSQKWLNEGNTMHSIYLINYLLKGIYYLKQSWLQMNSWSKTWIVKYDNNNKKDEREKG